MTIGQIFLYGILGLAVVEIFITTLVHSIMHTYYDEKLRYVTNILNGISQGLDKISKAIMEKNEAAK